MLRRCCSVLLLCTDDPLIERYKALGTDLSIVIRSERHWHNTFRVSEDNIVCEPAFLPLVNEKFYDRVTLLLIGKTPAPYIKMGIEHFVFDRDNDFELICSMFTSRKIVTRKAKSFEILNYCDNKVFCTLDYKFDFERGVFKYKEKPIYLADHEKKFLVEWLLMGHKDNAKRMMLCNMRKRYGSDFLKEINRYGKIKEEKENEQSS